MSEGGRIVSLREAKRLAKEDRKRADPAAGGRDGDGEPLAELADCPVRPLGNLDGQFYFFDPQGQIRELSATALGQRPALLALFGDRQSWLVRMFPAMDADHKPTGGFAVSAVNGWLVDQCVKAGLWRSDEPRRGHGVWRAGDGVLVHLGGEVWQPTSGERFRAGFRAHGALWPALFGIVPPANEAATAADAMRLEAAFERWRWEEIGSGAVFFGLWAAGLLGAAIPWRPHGLVCGQAGSGKSSLLSLYAACSPLCLSWNDYTEAGLRQALSGRAGPFILDEAEGDTEGAHKLQKVVELLRRTSGGGGAQVVRGAPGGKSQTFEVSAAAVLGGILPPVLLPQDASRITRLDLMSWARGVAPIPGEAEIAELGKLAPALWARALDGLPRYRANLETFRAELIGRGCPPRSADQLGAILAARAMMLADMPLEPRQAAEDVDAYGWLAVTDTELAEDGGPASCWRLLLSSPADVTFRGERPTVRRLIVDARHPEHGADARRLLIEHGLRLASYPQREPGAECLYIADRNPRLERIFAETPWSRGRWKEDLRRLPGAFRPGTQWVLTKERCTVLPGELLPGEAARPATLAELEAIAADHGRDLAWTVSVMRAGMTKEQARIDALAARG